MSRRTYARIKYKIVDIDAKADASFSITDMLAKTSTAQIKDDIYTVGSDNRETLEHNLWDLDGAKLIAPDNPATITWGLWTNSLTGSSGAFVTPPELLVTFVSAHTSAGVTLYFAGDTWPSSMTITWYNGVTVLDTQTFAPDDLTYFAKRTVSNFNKIKIAFAGTQIPNRRLKIAEIDYGGLIVWSKTKLISANVLEEVNLTSDELTIGTLDFSVFDDNAEFNMLNPLGMYAALQQKQELEVDEFIDGVQTAMGKYYLSTWKNTSSVVAEFSAFDVLGLFDTVQYKTSSLWAGTAASTVFTNIFAAAGFTNYTIESDISSELVYGYIPVVSVRKALHLLCFSLRAACVVKRDGSIAIRRLPSAAAANAIEKTQKYGSQSVEQMALINSVAVTAHSYTSAASSTIYTAALAAGTFDILFKEPANGLGITGATINASGVNYANITVSTPGTVTITGTKLVDSTKIHLYEAGGLTSSTRVQAAITDITLASPTNAAGIAQYIYNDYQHRIVQSFDLMLEDEMVGDNVDVDTMLNARATGVIVKLDIDLTGGFLADCEVRG